MKIFYKNLFNEICNKESKVDDILKIISVYENEISRLTWYSSRYNYIEDFLSKYTNIQDEVFEIIADKSNMSLEEVRTEYEKCNNSQLKIDSLSLSKNEFYNYITETRKSDKMKTIYEVYEQNYGYTKKLS